MALKLSKQFKGITADYWKIMSTVYDAIPNQTRVILGLYISKEARELDANNFVERIVFAYTGELGRDELYSKIKSEEMFLTAEDI